MKCKKLLKHGWQGRLLKIAKSVCRQIERDRPQLSSNEILGLLDAVRAIPENYVEDTHLKKLALALISEKKAKTSGKPGAQREASRDSKCRVDNVVVQLSHDAVPYRIWGKGDIEPVAIEQMDIAAHLPVARKAALMPDAHFGYGLPIGGVLGLQNAVCPYAVGVDIACRMRMTIVDSPAPDVFDTDYRHKLRNALISQTRFGVGGSFENPNEHNIMDDPSWSEIAIASELKNNAWKQLGTSGGGNHFVEFGVLILQDGSDIDLPAGNYLALVSHSGSRNLGAQICTRYSRIAKQVCSMPPSARHLAWLEMDSDAGQEYWQAMNLAGRYAAANHEIIHRRVIDTLGFEPLANVENHHNFAWKELHDGEEIIVHRKGATPADHGVLGIIPGNMADSGFLVRGLGNPVSLNSASHGAGRQMSRKAAKKRISRSERDKYLAEKGVELLGGGLDESPQAYKSIHTVMASQRDLVKTIGEFKPRIVLMASD